MSLNYVKDPGVQIPNLNAAGDGVDAVVRYYQNGTDEVKNLLKNECSMIYECSCCRALFRSIINFVAHKRTICRSLQSTIQAEQLEIAKQSVNEQNKRESDKAESAVAVPKRSTRNNRLRRFNPANSVSKHIRAVNLHLERTKSNIEVQTLPKIVRPTAKTSIVDGKQIVEQLPTGLAIKDRIPDDRVVLVMPSENSTRYGEMQLRRRRSNYLVKKDKEDGNGSTRELTGEEIAIVERIPSAMPVDFIKLRCEDIRCVKNNQQPFHHLAELAHHLAIQHQIDYAESSLLKKSTTNIQCFLCDVHSFKTLNGLQKHFNAMHSTVLAQHIKYRLEQFNSDPSKRKEAQNYRARSLSPLSDAEIAEEAKELKQQSKEKEDKTTNGIVNGKRGTRTNKIPNLKFNGEEEHEQQLSAAFALKKWIEASKQTEENDSFGKNEKNSPSNQICNQIIDEEEARKIDQLLNSKAPREKEKTKESDGDSAVGEGPISSSMALSRSPRSRKPNKKYEDYNDLVNGGSGSTSAAAKRTTIMSATVKELLDTASREMEKLQSAQKRKLASTTDKELPNTKSKFKWKKMRFEPPTGNIEKSVKESVITDFVLPESIKMNDKQEGEKEKSNEGSTTPPSELSSTNGQTNTDTGKIDNKSNSDVTPTPPSSNKSKLPSLLTDRYKEELILYSPKARMLKNVDKQKRNFLSEPSRRKQNLNELQEGDGLSMISTNVTTSLGGKLQKTPSLRPPPPPKPKDLSVVPIYLTETQRDLFFKPLKLLFNQNEMSDGPCQCGECGELLKNVKNGHRHMTSHIRIIRMRCSLCDAGAFYCSDMRIHLMYRYCEKLNLAPEEFINPGNPCMDKEKADMLTQLVDPYSPGRIMYSTGKIVSWNNPVPYLPDPKYERNILGPMLPGYMPSPNSSPKKPIRSAILSPKKIIRQPPPKENEEKPKDNEPEEMGMDAQNEASTSTSMETAGSSQQNTDKNVAASAGIYDDHAYPLEIRNEEEEEE